MADEARMEKDPLGNSIFLLPDVCMPVEKAFLYTNEAATTVITRPAMVVEVTENGIKSRFYYRSIEWQHTMLIEVRFNDNRWETYRCIENPSSDVLAEIVNKGRHLLG
jgi:hypothetical protein